MTETTTSAGRNRPKSEGRQVTFRNKASERLPMAEQLDRTLSVTSARGWIALLAILVTAAAVGVWSVVGEVATYVEAHGFLLNRGGKVVDAVAAGSGRLSTVAVAVGDEIEKDAVVALIVNEELAARYTGALALVEERIRALDALKAAVAAESGLVRANNARRRKQIDELETTARDMLEIAQGNLANSKRLFDERIVTRGRLENAQRDFNEARRVVLDLGRERDALETNEIKYRNDNQARIREMGAQVEAAERQAREFEALVAAKRVPAPVSGQVIEIKVTGIRIRVLPVLWPYAEYRQQIGSESINEQTVSVGLVLSPARARNAPRRRSAR